MFDASSRLYYCRIQVCSDPLWVRCGKRLLDSCLIHFLWRTIEMVGLGRWNDKISPAQHEKFVQNYGVQNFINFCDNNIWTYDWHLLLCTGRHIAVAQWTLDNILLHYTANWIRSIWCKIHVATGQLLFGLNGTCRNYALTLTRYWSLMFRTELFVNNYTLILRIITE